MLTHDHLEVEIIAVDLPDGVIAHFHEVEIVLPGQRIHWIEVALPDQRIRWVDIILPEQRIRWIDLALPQLLSLQ